MTKYKIIIAFSCLIFSLNAHAQVKNEKETRIELDAFPIRAKNAISPFIIITKRIKHYKEVDGNKTSFESKFKYNKKWYSVEFDSTGILEDIEVLIKEKDVDQQIKNSMTSYLEDNSEKFDFIKIQKQFKYDSNEIDAQFIRNVLENGTTILPNYEIILALKKDSTWELKEMLFDSLGHLISSRTLQPTSYEHIMY